MTPTSDPAPCRRASRWVPQSLVAGVLAVTSFAVPWWLAGLAPGVVLPPALATTPDRPPAVFAMQTADAGPHTARELAEAEAPIAPEAHAPAPAPEAPVPTPAPTTPPAPNTPVAASPAGGVSDVSVSSPASPAVAPTPVLTGAGLRRPLIRAPGRRSHRARAANTPRRPARNRGPSRQHSANRKPSCTARDHPDIAAVGTDRYRINRDLVDHYTGNLREAARLAHVAWHRSEDGKIDGFRIRRIRCGSVLHEAGFRNGDVVHSVNGRPVRTLPQALGAYRRLRKKRKLWLEVTRRGDTRTLRYTLG